MNILDLGKRGNRQLLEHACRRLTDGDAPRQISYTAVKHAIAAIRAKQDARPTTDPAVWAPADAAPPSRPPAGRDTSRAHLAGISAFRLDSLIGRGQGIEGDDA